ncbi:AGAP008348-PA-like protein [Anopheles sinensis]|uniref:Metallo-beta-lactamase domain-containing protein 1 n=1 Tax=Anopheles sinensis TaxID=74873 RepID=A0A084W5T5_ANOSI|nr:AGAP008348-PA-like protein [Anopheles sinensis]
MRPWDRFPHRPPHLCRLLEAGLQEHQLHPDDIDYVVSTHGHSDHLGNNNLFLRAKRHIVGTNISLRNRYYVHDFEAGKCGGRKYDGGWVVVIRFSLVLDDTRNVLRQLDEIATGGNSSITQRSSKWHYPR